MKFRVFFRKNIDYFVEFVEDNKKFTGFIFVSLIALSWAISENFSYETILTFLGLFGGACSHAPKHWFLFSKRKLESMKNFKFNTISECNTIKDRGTYKFNYKMKPLNIFEKEFEYYKRKIKIKIVLISDFSKVEDGSSGFATYNLYDFSTSEPYIFYSLTECTAPEICIQQIDRLGNFVVIVGVYTGAHTQLLNIFNYNKNTNKLEIIENGVIGSDFSNIVWGVKKNGYFYINAYHRNWNKDREMYDTELNSYKLINNSFILENIKNIKIR